jgi:hypothetical protein
MTDRDTDRPEEGAGTPTRRRVVARPEPDETEEEFSARFLAMIEAQRNTEATDD